MTKSLLLFSAGRLFRQQKVGHGNETKCFGIRNNSFIQTKKYFSDSSTQQKKIFFIPRPKQKKYFRFLDPAKKKYFRFFRPKQKKTFLYSSTQTRHFHDQILAAVFSWLIVSLAASRSWK